MDEAVVLTEGLFKSTDAKTAHGLIRHSYRYKIVGIIDSSFAGKDAGELLDGIKRNIKIYTSLQDALNENPNVKYLIVGVSTVGGKLPDNYRSIIKNAIEERLNIVSGLHEYISDDPEFLELAGKMGVKLIDVRKIYNSMKIFYSGKIHEVRSFNIVVLGTDAAVGKRTLAWMLTNKLNEIGLKTILIGTGQTSWMQGAKYGIVLDAMINDFITGGLEHEIWRAYINEKPNVIIIPSQGSLIHPVFPAGLEIISIIKPDFTVLIHAPHRKHYEDFPEYLMPRIEKHLKLIKLLTDKKVGAVAINNEGLSACEALEIEKKYEDKYGIPTCTPLIDGVDKIVYEVRKRLSSRIIAE